MIDHVGYDETRIMLEIPTICTIDSSLVIEASGQALLAFKGHSMTMRDMIRTSTQPCGSSEAIEYLRRNEYLYRTETSEERTK